jgi:hypothetical protein
MGADDVGTEESAMKNGSLFSCTHLGKSAAHCARICSKYAAGAPCGLSVVCETNGVAGASRMTFATRRDPCRARQRRISPQPTESDQDHVVQVKAIDDVL